MTRQEVSIVSDVAGTTTDPVEKPMELLPLGPVLFIDTAGIDDRGRWAKSGCKRPGRCSTAPTWACSWSTPGVGRVRGGASSASCRAAVPVDRRLQQVATWPSRRPAVLDELREAKTPACRDGGVRGSRRVRVARGADPGRPRGFPAPAGDGGRSGAAGRDGRAGRAHRHGSAQGPADRAAGANDPRPAGRRRLLPGGQGAGAARRLGPAEPPAGPGGDRFAGVPEGRGRHAAGR